MPALSTPPVEGLKLLRSCFGSLGCSFVNSDHWLVKQDGLDFRGHLRWTGYPKRASVDSVFGWTDLGLLDKVKRTFDGASEFLVVELPNRLYGDPPYGFNLTKPVVSSDLEEMAAEMVAGIRRDLSEVCNHPNRAELIISHPHTHSGDAPLRIAYLMDHGLNSEAEALFEGVVDRMSATTRSEYRQRLDAMLDDLRLPRLG
jgi:hypothetical protein